MQYVNLKVNEFYSSVITIIQSIDIQRRLSVLILWSGLVTAYPIHLSHPISVSVTRCQNMNLTSIRLCRFNQKARSPVPL